MKVLTHNAKLSNPPGSFRQVRPYASFYVLTLMYGLFGTEVVSGTASVAIPDELARIGNARRSDRKSPTLLF